MRAELQSNQLYMNLGPTFSLWYLDANNATIIRGGIVNKHIASPRLIVPDSFCSKSCFSQGID